MKSLVFPWYAVIISSEQRKELLVMQYPTILPISPEIVEVPGLELSEVELLVITAQGIG